MAEKPWTVKIESQVRSMEDKEAESEQWSKRSIYRIPASVTELKKQVYKPQFVSFGPYHHGEDRLKGMEKHKRRALLHFLRRSDKTVHDFIDVLAPVAQDLKDAYDQLDPKWQDDTDAFLEMMIVDGCFILEILRTTTNPANEVQIQIQIDTPQSNSRAAQPQPEPQDQDYASNDPVFSEHGKLYIVPYLKRDMLMLENQIPMLVLEKLDSIHNDIYLKISKELPRRILNFFSQPASPQCLRQVDKCLHILDVYRKSLLIDESHVKRHKPKSGHHHSHQGSEDVIPSATELNEAGITIAKSRTRSLKNISFQNGILRLPQIMVDDTLESIYLNMIAYERFHVGAGNEIASYIFFMDNIIDNSQDVSLLHVYGIIQNALGSNKEVAALFNSMSKDVTLDPDSRLGEVRKQVIGYCQQPWHRWRANLMHTYFTNPWAILSVVAAVLLFALTIVQTIYSVLSYVSPR